MSNLSPSEFFASMSPSEREAYRRAYLAEYETDAELAEIAKAFQKAWGEVGAREHWTHPAGLRARRLDRQHAIENDVLRSFMEAYEAGIAA